MAGNTFDRRINIYINGKQVENNIKSIRGAMTKLINEQAKMTIGSKEYVEHGRKIKALKGIMDEHRQSLKQTESGWSKLKAQIKSILPLFTFSAAVAGIGKLLGSTKRMVDEFEKARQKVKDFTGLTGVELDKVTKKTITLSKVWEKDFNEVLVASNTFAKEMGISHSRSLALINEGFEKGADNSGDFLNQLKEYPSQLKTIGIDAEETIAIITQQVREGIYSDKGIDAIKEAGIRIREMTPATLSALKNIGLSGEEIKRQLDEGSITMLDVIKRVSARLNELPETSNEVGAALADIFGGPGEDAGIRYIKTLKDVNGNLSAIADNTPFVLRMQRSIKEEWVSFTTNVAKGDGLISKVYGNILSAVNNTVKGLRRLNENTVKNLRNEQAEINVLVSSITSLNEGNEIRGRLIKEIQRKYPDLLKNLDAENVTNSDLLTNLKLVNEEYIKRIKLAVVEEDLTENFEKQKNVQREQNELVKQINENYNSLVKNKNENATLDEKLNEIAKVTFYQTVGYRTVENNYAAAAGIYRKNLNSLQEESNELTKEYNELIGHQVDIQKELVVKGSNDNKLGDSFPKVKTEKELKEEFKILQGVLDSENEAAILKLKEQRNNELLTDDSYKTMLLLQDFTYLEAKKELYRQYGEDTTGIEQDIADKEYSIKAGLSEKEKDLYEKRKKENEDFTSALMADVDSYIDSQVSALERQQEEEERLINERASLYKDFGYDMGNMFSEFSGGILLQSEELGRSLILNALDVLRNFVIIAIGRATADSFAKYGPLGGAIRSGLLSGLINGAFNVAKNAVSKDFFNGGDTGSGGKYEPAGTVHRGEYVVAHEEYARPDIRGFIQNVVEPARVNRLSYMGYSGIPGYADGGSVATTTQQPATINQQQQQDFSIELKRSIDMNNILLSRALNEGLSVSYDKLEKTTSDMALIKGKAAK